MYLSFALPAEIEDVLSSSLVQIERNLHEQLNVAAQLRDQSNRYELPDASQRIDEIMVSGSSIYIHLYIDVSIINVCSFYCAGGASKAE